MRVFIQGMNFSACPAPIFSAIIIKWMIVKTPSAQPKSPEARILLKKDF